MKLKPIETSKIVPSSFRDPSGFVFLRGDTIYRQINKSYQHDYEALMKSGLYNNLVDNNLLIRHIECNIDTSKSPDLFKIIKPDHIPFISYPYEWCYSQLKDAALCTLKIQKKR